MKRIFFSIFCIATLSLHAVNYCATSAFGNGKNATGGGSATPTLVTSVSELKSALNKAQNKVVIITKDLTFTSMLSVQGLKNVTILGLPGVELISNEQTSSTSGILFVKKSSNVIIRNLTFIGPGAYDCDGNDNLCFENVTNAWVDHCDFQDGCDGNFDIKGESDNITVSWCYFHYLKEPKAGGSGGADDHRFTNLLGSSSSDKPADEIYNVTYAYNYWGEGCKERMVRCRNCELHFLNCYWNSSVANYYVGPENASCYFEGCTFAGKANSSSKIFKSYGGTNACKFVNCAGNTPSNSGSVSAPSYSYDKLTAANALSYVTNTTCGAGATLTINSSGAIASSCDTGGTTVDPDPVDPDPQEPTDPTTVTSDLTWNFSATEFTSALGSSITSSTTINGLTILGTSDKPFTYADNSKTIEGISFTKVLKTGGSGNANYRNLSFEVTGPCTIEVYLISANTQDTRTLNIYSGSYGGDPIATMEANNETATKQSFSYSGTATTIYMGSASSGINLYAINRIYSEAAEPEASYTLTYDENGGSGEMAEQTGTNITVASNSFTAPTGYAFKEWNDNAQGAGTTYTAGQQIVLTRDMILYAVWSPKSYTVTLDAEGGSNGTTSISATFDAAMPNITIPSREGYTFLGYFSEQNGSGKQYYDANGSSTNSWTTASNATLYAAWEEKETEETTTSDSNLHFWFFYEQDATDNGLTNDANVFSGMVASGSQMAGSITIDGTSYTVTRRTGDNAQFGAFTIPTGKSAIFYALAVSSGSSSRQINLVCGTAQYELEVPGGSSTYQRLESDTLPAGTYRIEREGSSNVRLGIAVLKFIDAQSSGEETSDPDPQEQDPETQVSGAIYYWQMSGTEAPTLDDVQQATGGTMTFKSSDSGKSFSVESTAYVESVPEDMKAADGKGLKMGANALYLIAQLTEGTFHAGDTVYICGYNGWKISSTAEHSGDLAESLTTGTSKSDYQMNYVILPSDASALYLMRAQGSGTCMSAIKVCRPASSTTTDVESIENKSAARKVLRNGQVLIIRDHKTYDLFGRPL